MLMIIRIVFLLIAISAAVRIIRSLLLKLSASFQANRAVPPVHPTADVPTTVLQQDPICGTYVAIDSSLKRIVQGRVIHFCSAECRDRYVLPAQSH